jgi:hypothetical protein
MKSATIIALNAKSYVALLQLAPKYGVVGGRTYDVLAEKAHRRFV